MKKILLNLLKFGIAAGIIGYLLYDASHGKNADQFNALVTGDKDWSKFGLAFLLFLASVSLTFWRWHVLVRALDFPFTLGAAFRLGFVGYLFNFVAPGGVGGDLFKAVFIAREYRDRRAQAVATVVVDRIVGLYALFLVACTAVLVEGLWKSESTFIRNVAYGTILGTIVGAIGILMLLIPGFTNGRLSKMLSNLPRAGRIFRQLLEAVRMYRVRMKSVAAAVGLSAFVHLFTVSGFYVLGDAIPGTPPTLGEQFVIIPIAMVISAVPITPGGLGTLEFAITELTPAIAQGEVTVSQAVAVSLVYRIMTIVIAMVGLVFYVLARRQVADVMHEAEEEIAEEEAAAAKLAS